MTRDFGRVRTSFWESDTVRELSPEHKFVGLYLLTSPHTNAIGCFRLPVAYVAHDTQMTPEALELAFAALRSVGFMEWCERLPWIWLPNYLKHNSPENPNVWRKCVKEMEALPAVSAQAHIAEQLYEIAGEERMANPKSKSRVSEEERERVKRYRNGIETVSHTVAKPLVNGIETVSEPLGNPIETSSKGLRSHARPCAPAHLPCPYPIPEPIPDTPSLRSGVEGAPQADAPPKPGKVPRGTRWPKEKQIPDDWLRDGELRRIENNLEPVDLRLEAVKFRNYWASKSGGDAAKLDWHLTWINWALGAKTGNSNGQGSSKRTGHSAFLEGAYLSARDDPLGDADSKS